MLFWDPEATVVMVKKAPLTIRMGLKMFFLLFLVSVAEKILNSNSSPKKRQNSTVSDDAKKPKIDSLLSIINSVTPEKKDAPSEIVFINQPQSIEANTVVFNYLNTHKNPELKKLAVELKK